ELWSLPPLRLAAPLGGLPLDVSRHSRNLVVLTAPSARGLLKGNHMKFYSQDRVALFIDGANLYATARSLGFDIDYKRLLNIFSDQCNLVRSLYYTALVEDQEYSPIRPLVDWLDYNGYTMVTKPAKEFT